jgi:hypothetical protein
MATVVHPRLTRDTRVQPLGERTDSPKDLSHPGNFIAARRHAGDRFGSRDYWSSALEITTRSAPCSADTA